MKYDRYIKLTNWYIINHNETIQIFIYKVGWILPIIFIVSSKGSLMHLGAYEEKWIETFYIFKTDYIYKNCLNSILFFLDIKLLINMNT